MRKSSRATLRDAFRRLEQEVPESMARVIRNLRHPDSRWIRIPVGVLLVIGGFIAPLVPLLGVWMLPIGLLLIAYELPFLRRPVSSFTIWCVQRWLILKVWVKRHLRHLRHAYDVDDSEIPPMRLGKMREHGVRSVAMHCQDIGCGHSGSLNVDSMPDDLRVPDVALLLRCSACGSRTVKTEPDWKEGQGARDYGR